MGPASAAPSSSGTLSPTRLRPPDTGQAARPKLASTTPIRKLAMCDLRISGILSAEYIAYPDFQMIQHHAGIRPCSPGWSALDPNSVGKIQGLAGSPIPQLTLHWLGPRHGAAVGAQSLPVRSHGGAARHPQRCAGRSRTGAPQWARATTRCTRSRAMFCGKRTLSSNAGFAGGSSSQMSATVVNGRRPAKRTSVERWGSYARPARVTADGSPRVGRSRQRRPSHSHTSFRWPPEPWPPCRTTHAQSESQTMRCCQRPPGFCEVGETSRQRLPSHSHVSSTRPDTGKRRLPPNNTVRLRPGS